MSEELYQVRTPNPNFMGVLEDKLPDGRVIRMTFYKGHSDSHPKSKCAEFIKHFSKAFPKGPEYKMVLAKSGNPAPPNEGTDKAASANASTSDKSSAENTADKAVADDKDTGDGKVPVKFLVGHKIINNKYKIDEVHRFKPETAAKLIEQKIAEAVGPPAPEAPADKGGSE